MQVVRLVAQPTRDIPSPHQACRIYISHAPAWKSVSEPHTVASIIHTLLHREPAAADTHNTKKCPANRKEASSTHPSIRSNVRRYRFRINNTTSPTPPLTFQTRDTSRQHYHQIVSHRYVVSHRTTYPPAALYHIITCSHSPSYGGCCHSTTRHNSQSGTSSWKNSEMVRLSSTTYQLY